MTDNVNNCSVNRKMVYTTRFVNNSKFSQSQIQSMMAMSKSKALEVYRKTCTVLSRTGITGAVFAQDGRQCDLAVTKLRSLCDGRLFSSVVAGRAPGKVDSQRSVIDNDLTTDDIECGHMTSPIHSTSIENHPVGCHKVVGGADNVDQNIKIFDINGLELAFYY